MADFKKLFAGTDQTRVLLATMVLNASGWDVGQMNAENLAGPSVYLYCWDRPTQWAWVCSVPKDSFDALALKSSRTPSEWDSVRSGVALVAANAALGKPVAPREGVDWESQLAMLLAAYAGTTKVWAAAQQMRDGGHFLVLNYRKAKSMDGLLRPTILPDASGNVLTAEDFRDRVQAVVALDKKSHPEWFA